MADLTKILDEIKELKLLEVAELVKMMEEEFGVSAAAAVVAAAPGAGAAAAEEKTDFDVVLTEAGAQKLQVIKVVVKSPVLVLRKLRTLLRALPQPLRKLSARKTLKLTRLSLKKLAQRLNLSNLYLLPKMRTGFCPHFL